MFSEKELMLILFLPWEVEQFLNNLVFGTVSSQSTNDKYNVT